MTNLLSILLIVAAIHGNVITLTARVTAQADGTLVIRTVLPLNARILSEQIEGGECGFGACATTALSGETRTMTQTIELDTAGQLGAIVSDSQQHLATATVRLYRFYLP